ncbi:restriction endonuclease subunit S [Aliarcobacter butzleri]|uniref:restriction endonuclease subunit S n=1 Tax=Aliarcobacter butzleri TaxID=28197 RepID=UPI0021B2A575|nr:restriction endonuclease subunit S [Aliarcobacter butzleri]MCT7605599.1 restriction endonuclease subunit S [Aliarcobacter butzleri]MCT7608072.1 restriction endonuclease subunit S [Aliarcobacter butzleri]
MIDNLPNGWKEEKIGNIIDLTIGKTPSRKKSEYFTGDNLWVSIADIKSINLTNTKEKITEQAIKDSNIKKVKAGTLIMSYKLSIGKMAFTSQDLYTNEAIVALNIKINDLDKKFLYYYLLNADLEKTTDRAVKGKTLNKAKIEQIHIQFPPLQQQEKIVKVLDLTSNLIEKQKELLEKYDLFLKSKFIEMFGDPITNPMGWEVVKLENICNKITDGTHNSPPMSENGFKYITAKHIKENKIDFEKDETYISEEEHKKIFSRCNPMKGDVLYIKDGATTGIACINTLEEEFSLLSSVALLKPSLNIKSEYIVLYLNNKSVKENILLNMAGGAIKRLTIKKIKDIEIPVPNIELQNKFASIVEKIETIKEKENQKLKQMNDLHNSMMNKAFKGEIK